MTIYIGKKMSHCLDGKVIKNMKVADDQKALLIITDQGELIVKVDGDCCSDTWIEAIETPALGFPAKVFHVENLDMPEPEKRGEFEVTTFYGCKIITDKGEIIIDYRNFSNGYYGGYLSWPDKDNFYGGVFGQNVSTENWLEISDVFN